MSFLVTFKLVSHLLVLTSLLALTVADGVLSYIIVAMVSAPVSWWAVEVRGRGLGKTSVNIVAALLAVFAVMDSIFISDAVLLGLAHLLVLVQALKLFQFKGNNDYLQMYAISLVHLLVASALTTDFIFSVFFVAYMALGTWAMLLFHLKKASESRNQDPQSIISRRLFTSTLSVVILSFATTAIFFVAIPRLGIGLTIKPFKTKDLISGFSENVELGEIGRIKKDSRIAMRVELLNAEPGEGFRPLWRGKVYDYYSNGQWKSLTPGGYSLLHAYGEKVTVPPQVRAGEAMVLKYKVQLERMDSRIIFLADSPAMVVWSMPYLIAGPSGTIYAPKPHLEGAKYTAYSFIPQRNLSNWEDPGEVDEAYLQLPPLSPKVKELATAAAQGGIDNYSKVRLIEEYLQNNYVYTLDLTMRSGFEPVEYFLFRNKRGNCEYFASAMALMLRSIGIPARLVGGFRGGEWNQFGYYYLVRQSNAHTWVEAYLPPAGWLSFDPTPSDPESSIPIPAFIKFFPRMVDALRWRWQSHIIAYDIQDQRMMLRKATRFATKMKLESAMLWERTWKQAKASLSSNSSRTVALLIVMGIIATLSATVIRDRNKSFLIKGGRQTSVKFYRRYLQIMARKGFRMSPHMTPLEFARRAMEEGKEQFSSCEGITDIYYRVRYGGELLGEDELKGIYHKLRMLEKASMR